MADKTRLSASRRAEYADAAIRAFARCGGFHGTTLNYIAQEAGVTQPRISQVYGNKLDAFLEAHDRAADTVCTFIDREFSRDRIPNFGAAYLTMLERHRDTARLIQIAYAAADVPEIATAARATFVRLWKQLEKSDALGGKDVAGFLAQGMLLQVLAAVGVPALADQDPELGRIMAAVNRH